MNREYYQRTGDSSIDSRISELEMAESVELSSIEPSSLIRHKVDRLREELKEYLKPIPPSSDS